MYFVLAASAVVAGVMWLTVAPSLLAYFTAFLLIYFFYVRMSEPYERFKLQGFDGPPPTFMFGNLMDLKEGFFYIALNNYNKYKSAGRKHYVDYMGRIPIIHILELDEVKQITIKEAATFTDRLAVDFNASPLDLNMLALSGDHWKHVRGQVTPTFSSGKLRNMTPLIQMAVDKIVKNVKTAVEKNEDVDVKEMTGAYTLDVIASTLFGLDIDSQNNPNDIFVVKAKKIFAGFGFSNIIIFLGFMFPNHIRYLKNFSFINRSKETIDFFRNVVEQCLEERKANPEKHRDFLQLMVDCEVPAGETDRVTVGPHKSFKWNSKGLTPDEILAQAVVFFLAGYETTANTLVFLVYLLCVYPDTQDKVAQEIQDELGDDLPNYDNVGKLQYLDMCIQETMRLYPQAPRVDRVANKTIDIGGLIIPKGQCVAIDIAGFHYDPQYWDEPTKFKPERFTAEARSGRHPALHMPFGMGPRNCVGMRLALLEMKMAVVEVLQKYRVVPADSTPRHEDLKLSKIGVCIPETPIKVRFTERY